MLLGLGLAVGGVVAYGIFRTQKTADYTDDEDRPTIIVRNGSLYIENTGGKKWKKKNHNSEEWWRMDHDKGHWPGFFEVSFEGGSGTCGPAYTPEITIYIQGDQKYQVTKRPRNPNAWNDKKLEPVILGTGLTASNSTLTNSAATAIVRVEYKTGPSSTATCTGPTQVTVQTHR